MNQATVVFENKFYDGPNPRVEVSKEFVEDNRLSLSRSQDEIIRYIKENDDMFGFTSDTLLNYLDFDHLKPLLKQKTEEEYAELKKSWRQIVDVYEAAQDLLDYLNFGFGKALDQRGISASRTVTKLKAWFWLLGREDLAAIAANDDLYNPYGMPVLIAISEKLGLPVNAECRKFAGNKCEDYC